MDLFLKPKPRPRSFVRESLKQNAAILSIINRDALPKSPGRSGDDSDVNKKWRLPILGRIRTESVLLLMTLLAVIGGTLIGLMLNPIISGQPLSQQGRMYLKFPGDLFLRMLKMLIVPLVISSNISAIASLNPKAARALTLLSLVYYVTTTMIAVFIGITFATIIQPGKERKIMPNGTLPKKFKEVYVVESVLDLVRSMVPINLMEATFKKTNTYRNYTPIDENANETLMNDTRTYVYAQKDADGTNILGLITFSVLFGFAVHSLGQDAAVLADLFHATRRVIIYLVSIVIWFSPLGILCLVAEELAKTEELTKSLYTLSMYVGTVMVTLFIHGCIVLPALLVFFTGRNPITYAKNMMQALICALGTASSTATLPCTIRCLERGNQIDVRVTRFMLPLGTTINMDGTAAFQAIAAVCIAQMSDRALDYSELILIALTSLLASMASTSMPSAGMITIAMVLHAIDLPDTKIIILFPVDWFLDRFRTMVNVFSNSVGAAILSQMCQKNLIDADEMMEVESLPDIQNETLHYVGGLADLDIEAYTEAAHPNKLPNGRLLSARHTPTSHHRHGSPQSIQSLVPGGQSGVRPNSPTSNSVCQSQTTQPGASQSHPLRGTTTVTTMLATTSEYDDDFGTSSYAEDLPFDHEQVHALEANSAEFNMKLRDMLGRTGGGTQRSDDGGGKFRSPRLNNRARGPNAPSIRMIDDETVFVEL